MTNKTLVLDDRRIELINKLVSRELKQLEEHSNLISDLFVIKNEIANLMHPSKQKEQITHTDSNQ